MNQKLLDYFNVPIASRDECARRLVTWALEQPRRRAFITCFDAATLQEMLDAVKGALAERLLGKYRWSPSSWRLANGSTIYGRIISDVSVRGNFFQALWYDGEVSEDNWIMFDCLAGCISYRVGERPTDQTEYIFRSNSG